MKTPMQELLERVKEYRDSETSPLVKSRLNSVYVDIVGMLEKEKEVSECKCVCGNCKQDPNKTGVYGVDTDDALQSWQTEIINKEIEDRYRENQEDPFGEHFSINPNSAKENE